MSVSIGSGEDSRSESNLKKSRSNTSSSYTLSSSRLHSPIPGNVRKFLNPDESNIGSSNILEADDFHLGYSPEQNYLEILNVSQPNHHSGGHRLRKTSENYINEGHFQHYSTATTGFTTLISSENSFNHQPKISQIRCMEGTRNPMSAMKTFSGAPSIAMGSQDLENPHVISIPTSNTSLVSPGFDLSHHHHISEDNSKYSDLLDDLYLQNSSAVSPNSRMVNKGGRHLAANPSLQSRNHSKSVSSANNQTNNQMHDHLSVGCGRIRPVMDVVMEEESNNSASNPKFHQSKSNSGMFSVMGSNDLSSMVNAVGASGNIKFTGSKSSPGPVNKELHNSQKEIHQGYHIDTDEFPSLAESMMTSTPFSSKPWQQSNSSNNAPTSNPQSSGVYSSRPETPDMNFQATCSNTGQSRAIENPELQEAFEKYCNILSEKDNEHFPKLSSMTSSAGTDSKGVNKSQKNKQNFSYGADNIPPNPSTDENFQIPSSSSDNAKSDFIDFDHNFGLVSLASFVTKTKNGESNIDFFAVGSDDDFSELKSQGLDLSLNEHLHQRFICPFNRKKERIRIFEIDASVPSEYVCYSPVDEKVPEFRPEKLLEDTLFFLYYSFPGDVLQMLAAGELYKRNWRFHTKLLYWVLLPFQFTTETEIQKFTIFDFKQWKHISRQLPINKSDFEPSSAYTFESKYIPKLGNELISHLFGFNKNGFPLLGTHAGTNVGNFSNPDKNSDVTRNESFSTFHMSNSQNIYNKAYLSGGGRPLPVSIGENSPVGQFPVYPQSSGPASPFSVGTHPNSLDFQHMSPFNTNLSHSEDLMGFFQSSQVNKPKNVYTPESQNFVGGSGLVNVNNSNVVTSTNQQIPLNGFNAADSYNYSVKFNSTNKGSSNFVNYREGSKKSNPGSSHVVKSNY